MNGKNVTKMRVIILKRGFINLKGSTKEMGVNTARHAVTQVARGENDVSSKPINHKIGKKRIIDWSEFWHLFISWFISGLIIFMVLVILTMAEKSTDLWKDIVIKVDTISLVFSLVLSAGLEQVWNNKKRWKYKLTQIGELTLAILGLVLYMAYSLWEIYDPCNPYYLDRFEFNMLYIVLSLICVVIGFMMRAMIEQEDK